MRLSFLLILICASCAGTEPRVSQTDSDELRHQYVTDEYGIDYPAQWTLDSTRKESIQFFLKTDRENQEDVFLENINLLKHEFTIDSLDFDGYLSRQLDIILDKTHDGNLIESSYVSDAAPPYQRIVYTGKTKTQEYKFLQHLMMNDSIGYLLTFTAEVEQFGKYHDEAKKVMSSFRFK